MFDPPTPIRSLITITAVVLAVFISPAGADDATKEKQLRAAFLLNFVRFTQWPDEALPESDSPFVIAVLGDDPFGRVLEQTFRGQKVHGRAPGLKRLRLPNRKDYESAAQYEAALNRILAEAEACQLIYMNLPNDRDVVSILKQLDGSTSLFVGHTREYAERGTHLALDRADENIVFYANVDVIKDSELDVSSKLLKLARVATSE